MICNIRRCERAPTHSVVHDGQQQRRHCIAAEGALKGAQLEQHNPCSPDVGVVVVGIAKAQLGRQVVRRANDGFGTVVLWRTAVISNGAIGEHINTRTLGLRAFDTPKSASFKVMPSGPPIMMFCGLISRWSTRCDAMNLSAVMIWTNQDQICGLKPGWMTSAMHQANRANVRPHPMVALAMLLALDPNYHRGQTCTHTHRARCVGCWTPGVTQTRLTHSMTMCKMLASSKCSL